MGNIQPTGTSGKSTPPNTPRRTSVPNFQEVAFGNTVQPMEGHAQGPNQETIMGQGQISGTSTGTGGAPRFDAQRTALGESASSAARTGFAVNVGDQPSHAQQAQQSSAIVPLPPNAEIRLLTEQQIRDLAPIAKRPKLALGELKNSSTILSKRVKFTATLSGIESHHALVLVIHEFLSWDFESKSIKFSKFKVKECSGGTRVSFEADGLLAKEQARKAYEMTRNRFDNLQAVGLLDVDPAAWLPYKLLPPCPSLYERVDWKLPLIPTERELRLRLECIETMLGYDCFGLALVLMSDFMRVDGNIFRIAIDHVGQFDESLPSGFKIVTDDLTGMVGFVNLVCCRGINHLVCRHGTDQIGEVGKFFLRDVMTTTDLAAPQYQISIFGILADQMDKLPEAERLKIVQRLLDLPGIDIGKLFLNPKAKLLLAAIPELREVFVEIADHAYEVFWDRKQKLEKKGLVFAQRSPAEPIEIDVGQIDESTVDALLELAEAAVMGQRTSWAIGILRFLSERVLDDEQIAKAKTLRDLIQSAVRHDPLPHVAATFENVKRLTDEAIAEIDPPPRN
jgi:hypothetical protein